MIKKLVNLKYVIFNLYIVFQICTKDLERCVLPTITYANLNTPLLEEDQRVGICISFGWWNYALRFFIEKNNNNA